MHGSASHKKTSVNVWDEAKLAQLAQIAEQEHA